MPNTPKNVSLYPLEFTEAVELLLKVPPEKKHEKPKKKKLKESKETKKGK